jgi:hypothetical protein
MTMGQINDGGPIGGSWGYDQEGRPEFIPGATIRDHFAGLAMQARLTGRTTRGLEVRHHIAADAYAMADAMIAARSKQEDAP